MSFLFGFIIYQRNIFIPHLTTFSITIIAIMGSIFYWTLTSYNLKIASLIQLFLLIMLFVIFNNNLNKYFIVLQTLIFLSITISIYINYRVFAPRIKSIYLPFTLPVLIIVLSALAIILNFIFIIFTSSKTFDSNILLRSIVIEIVQNEVIGLGLGIGIYLSNIILQYNKRSEDK